MNGMNRRLTDAAPGRAQTTDRLFSPNCYSSIG